MKQFDHVETYLEIIAGYRDIVTGLRSPMAFCFSPIINLARYDNAVLESMSNATINGLALTERQGELAIKIVVKYKRQLANKLVDTAPIEESPTFRIRPRKMDYTRSLALRDGKLQLRFPYNNQLIEQIRSFKKDSQGACEFNMEQKIWAISLTEYNLNWSHAFASTNEFTIDPEVEELNNQLLQVERTPYKIELVCENGELDITNCPVSMRKYIEEKLGGLNINNLERIVDNAGELGFTIDESLEAAINEQFGPLFLSIAKVKEAKLQNVTIDKFKDLMGYAIKVGRLPVVIYEPDMSNTMFNMLISSYTDKHIQVISTKKRVAIEDTADFVHTVTPLRNAGYIPMLVSTAGMVYGSDKQIMFQNSGKVLYLTANVYKPTSQPGGPVEKIEI